MSHFLLAGQLAGLEKLVVAPSSTSVSPDLAPSKRNQVRVFCACLKSTPNVIGWSAAMGLFPQRNRRGYVPHLARAKLVNFGRPKQVEIVAPVNAPGIAEEEPAVWLASPTISGV
ncbi:hypothetical protein THAOC_06648 [Thalassiosira oceanica]|uniref:Uncharacterized protein n=1 Tax=Thalassiosira oceanica TaxID=159749 RepID=K0SZR6_THAOC|nr:hypothetical protein THAOC_06648 [Thalassiosira oceanica]|eukprot:EJK71868.1 hypothetical protein THAOC_06648 [Thalassiosira oceanica]